MYPSVSDWWFALTVSGCEVSTVQIKDSGSLTTYATMTKNVWGGLEVYTYTPQGIALVTPISVKITSTSNVVETVSVSQISANEVFSA